MIKKIVVSAATLLIFGTCISGCSNTSDDRNTSNVDKDNNSKSNSTQSNSTANIVKSVRMAIFPTGMDSDTYLFKLGSDGGLEVMTGDKKSEDIRDTDYIEPSQTKKRVLSETEHKNILELVKDIENDNSVLEKVLMKGGWEVVILINDKIYDFNYGDYDDIGYGKLVNALIEYSPLEIDIHSWS